MMLYDNKKMSFHKRNRALLYKILIAMIVSKANYYQAIRVADIFIDILTESC